MYLVRKGKVEFSGTKHAIVEYIKEAYSEDYYVQEYWEQLEKDLNKLKFVIGGLDLKLTERKPRRKNA